MSEETTVFTDGNAGANRTTHYAGIENISAVDLEVAAKIIWNEDDETTRKKSAEVLVWKSIGLDKIKGFVTRSESVRKKVGKMLQAQNINMKVQVVRGFYY